MDDTPRRLTFGAHAAEYERARPGWPRETAEWFVPEGARVVVELGAGTGKLTRELAALGVPVLAVEPDPRMLAVLREHGLDGVPGSAEEIPVADGQADAVVAGSCLHWFDLERALPEIHRVLRPGGRFAYGWNHRDARVPGIDRMNDIIAAARPGGQGWRLRDWGAAVTDSGLFGELERAEFRFELVLPRADLEAHLLSYSGIPSLSADELAVLVDEVGSLVERDPLRIPFVVDGFRVTRV